MTFSRAYSIILPILLWIMYLSIINLKAAFTFSYGWEWLTCESGFIAIFLLPVLYSRSHYPASVPPSRATIWLFRWLAFRLMLGAGMSKLGRNSSACWKELTCTTTHYYTQPLPSPLAYYAHWLPLSVHKFEVSMTFVEQLVLPVLMLLPLRSVRIASFMLESALMMGIVGTGSYAWINFIGLLPCIALLDDDFLSYIFSSRSVTHMQEAEQRYEGLGHLWRPQRALARLYRLVLSIVVGCLVLFMAWKSRQPLGEMFGPAPWINSYDEYFLMNSQGVFGFINSHRVQPLLQFSHDSDAHRKLQDDTTWKTLDFACLPGRPERFPCIMSPYHSRLDWETWIRTTASMEHLLAHKAGPESYFQQTPHFLGEIMARLLAGDDDTADLFATPRDTLFPNATAPKFMRLRYFKYTFSSPGSEAWWNREPLDGGIGIVWPQDHAASPETVRTTKSERKAALFLGCIGLAWSLDLLLSQGRLPVGLPAAAFFASAFALWLFEDYDSVALLRYELPPQMLRVAQGPYLAIGHAAQGLLKLGVVRSDRGLAALMLLLMMVYSRLQATLQRIPGSLSLAAATAILVAVFLGPQCLQ
eukprot:TRINITY_DN45355_c0_g1_i1.p1 TRINITY_DN45355_c0_g1~~TRINITY_DN45355_c0_g1_i1.p1  ORF type:complete len:587 (+),score=70.24 TRINITY_DN45355_c0_g1_i1:236-1996(+)